MEKQDLLFEIGLEELPPKQIQPLAQQLLANLCERFKKLAIEFDEGSHYFATPRRIAVLIKGLARKQPDFVEQRKGPSVKIAYDAEGNPSKAALGFAASCGVAFAQLDTQTLEQKGEKQSFLFFSQSVAGQHTLSLLPDILADIIKTLPMNKPMRWADSEFEFVRPIHWFTCLFGDDVVDFTYLGIKASANTYGHRFHHPEAIPLKHADNYQQALAQTGKVIASWAERQQKINEDIHRLAEQSHAMVIINPELLAEVTGLVELPVALKVDFDPSFLAVPEEALISAMQSHQKVFHLVDKTTGKLLPAFITVANIASKNPQQVVQGNQKVMRARLADAAFFYATDCQHALEHRYQQLESILFQKQLGNLLQRAQRLERLAEYLAKRLQQDHHHAGLAARLAKVDLLSDMVGEFPELQGIMGYYYALNDNLPEDVAMGIRGQYMPRFAGDTLPQSNLGCIVSLADRVDKLVGIFAIGQQPTGEKDPFALRRAAIGLINIIIEKHYELDLSELLMVASENYPQDLVTEETREAVRTFIFERLKHWGQDKGISTDTFMAVNGNKLTSLYDFFLRCQGVNDFRQLPAAPSLAAANKRVSKILSKEHIHLQTELPIETDLFNTDEEHRLFKQIQQHSQQTQQLLAEQDYSALLAQLANLEQCITDFFAEVMVNVEDQAIRKNRLGLLQALRRLFLSVADISQLQDKKSP